jgi:hypothetical protein
MVLPACTCRIVWIMLRSSKLGSSNKSRVSSTAQTGFR